MSPLLLAALVVAVIALAYYYYYRHPATVTYAPPTAPGTLWTTDPAGKLTCSGSSNPGFCILATEAAAQAACSANPACIGYLKGNTGAGVVYQLTTSKPIPFVNFLSGDGKSTYTQKKQ